MDSARPDVTVIVTSYNIESYIGRAIESVLSQTGVSLEVIVVDDASSDGTWSVISSYDEPRLTKLRRERNGGPGASRNDALAVAKGRWIAVLDGDDAFAPGRLAHCVVQGDAALADMVVDNITVLREADGARFPMFPPESFRQKQYLDLGGFIEGNLSFMGGYAYGYLKPLFSSAFLARHSLSYDPAIRIGEDYLLFAQCLARGAVCRVDPMQGYIYTARAGSTSYRLRPRDIARISLRDKKFLRSHVIDAHAARAQGRRRARIRDAFGFLLLVEAIKARKISRAVRVALRAPLSARHLWRPVWSRLSRILPLKTA